MRNVAHARMLQVWAVAAACGLLAPLAVAQMVVGAGGGGVMAPTFVTTIAGGGFNRIANNQGTTIYNSLKTQLTLTDDQQAKIKAVCDALDQQLVANQQRMNNARMAGQGNPPDPAALQKVQADQQAIMADRPKILAEKQTEIDELLTADQRATWATYNVTQDITSSLRLVGDMAAEQQDKLTKLFKAAGAELAAAKDAHGEATVNSVYGKLWKSIYATVLTDEQAAKAMRSGSFASPIFNGGQGVIHFGPAGGAVQIKGGV